MVAIDRIGNDDLSMLIGYLISQVKEKRMTMKAAIESNSFVGAGHTIGYNVALDNVIEIIENFANHEYTKYVDDQNVLIKKIEVQNKIIKSQKHLLNQLTK